MRTPSHLVISLLSHSHLASGLHWLAPFKEKDVEELSADEHQGREEAGGTGADDDYLGFLGGN